MISNILIVGADSAGLLAAVNLKSRLPELRICVLRHPLDRDLQPEGIATTPEFPRHIHDELGVPPADFLKSARPIWRIGTRYQWGPRAFFDHTCEFQVDTRYAVLSRETGFYLTDGPADFENVGPASARMSAGRVFLREKDGTPQIVPGRFGYHIEISRLQNFLELAAKRLNIPIRDGTVAEVIRGEMGVGGVRLEGGEVLAADLYVDATETQSLLLERALAVPFESYGASLLCDSAVIAMSPRTDEPIGPHTQVTTMDCGWSWQTEHEMSIGRGYAFSSAHLKSDEAANALRKLSPKSGEPRLIKFRQGRHEHCWVQNVIGIGGAAGFVEPLAAAGPAVLAFQCQWLATSLVDCDRVLRPTILKQFNKRWRRLIETEREFLGLFYRYNTRLPTPFWRDAASAAHLGSLEELVRCFRDVGPDSLHRTLLLAENDPIGLEGYFSVLLGQNVPRFRWQALPAEAEAWKAVQESWRRRAAAGFTVEEMLRHLGSSSSPPRMMTGATR